MYVMNSNIKSGLEPQVHKYLYLISQTNYENIITLNVFLSNK